MIFDSMKPISGGVGFISYQHPVVLLLISSKLGGGKGKQKDLVQ